MKLRNKKTGEIVYVNVEIPICVNNEITSAYYIKSLEEFNARFEDYKPKEPADTTKDQDTIEWLKSENAYLRGKIYAYENFLKDKGYIKKKELEEGEQE